MDRATADALRDCRVARWAATLACLGLALDLTSATGDPQLIEIAAIAVTASAAAWLWLRRDHPSHFMGAAAFLLVNAAVIASLWVSSQRLAESTEHWVPFRPHHLGALAVALLAPSRAWVGIVTIAGFTSAAVLQFALFDPTIRARLPYGDPWATLAFGGFAIGLYLFRLRANRIEQEIAIVHTRVVELERFARTMLAVRDLTNTPLQTLELIADLLRAEAAGPHDVADRIERAVHRMKEIEHLASAYETEVAWSSETASFDPRAILQAARPLQR